MGRKKSRAKGLKPQKCEICKTVFQPWTSRQKTCANKECQRLYENKKQREYYYKVKDEKKKIKTIPLVEDKRNFFVRYTNVDGKWFWQAKGDNGSLLQNGPFETINDARKDYHEATE